MTKIGDFAVVSPALALARDEQADRGALSRGVDAEERAPVTTNAQKWAENKSQFDFPGIDTPSENPDLLPKDLKSGNPSVAREARGEPSVAPEETSTRIEKRALAENDVPLSPDEAFFGAHSESSQSLDRTNRIDGTELSPTLEEEELLESFPREER
jgi:hypothetical protein